MFAKDQSLLEILPFSFIRRKGNDSLIFVDHGNNAVHFSLCRGLYNNYACTQNASSYCLQVNLYSGALFIQQALNWNLYIAILLLLAVTAFCTVTGRKNLLDLRSFLQL